MLILGIVMKKILVIAGFFIALAACSDVEKLTLAGSEWKPVFQDIKDTGNAFVRFGDDGRVNGSSGCNMMQGGFTLTGDQITIGPLAMTRMACLDGLGIVQQRFVGALEKATKASLEGLTLSLYDGDGRKILELRKVSSNE